MRLELQAEGRYDRQERIRWWDQDRLAQARVLVVGAGAIGNEVVKNLVLMGVGSIVVVDFDEIEASNLARCVFFRKGDDGRLKVDALVERASELNPNVEVVGLSTDVRAIGTGIALRADVMVGALDNREARLYVNRLAWRTGKAWVDGAIESLFGTARVFAPPRACYECTLTEADFAALAHRQSCRLLSREEMALGRTPTTATMASVVGGLQAQEVVKIMHLGRQGVSVMNGGIIVDGANNDAYPVQYPFDGDCLAHHTFTDPVRIEACDALTFKDVVSAAGLSSAVVELADDHLLTWYCPACEDRTRAATSATLVKPGHADCPTCREPRQFDVTSSVAVPSELADTPLVDLGIRSDEILAIRSGLSYRYVWLVDGSGLPESWR